VRKKPPRRASPRRAVRAARAARIARTVERKDYLFEIQEKQGTVAITGPRGVPVFPKFWVGVELAGGEVFTSCQTGLSAGSGAWVTEVANGRLIVELSIRRSAAPNGVLLQATVRNRGPEPIEIRQIRVAHAVTGEGSTPWGPAAEWSLLRMGYAPGAAHREDPDPRGSALVSFADARVVTRSWGVAALRFSPARPRGLVAGFVTSGSQLAWIDVRRDRHTIELAAVCDTEGVCVPAGRAIRSETLFLGLHEDVRAGLAEFGELCGRRMGANSRPVPTGWSSRHSWRRADLSEAGILRQVRFIAAHRKALPLDVLLIDEGWSDGDWSEAKERFPHGLAAVAAEIAAAGLVPGLALAPFTASGSSRLFRERPDWMVKDELGKPLGWDMERPETRELAYGLDGSHPEVQEWLRELFSSLRRLGFRYFKLDTLFMGCIRGYRAEPVTRVAAYRRGLEAIRAGAGDAYLLAAAAPALPSAGLVDGMRVCPDVHLGGRLLGGRLLGGRLAESFPAAMREAHQKWWSHRTLWNNDPDAVLVRPIEGSTMDEARAVAASAEFSGGAIFAGEPLDELAPDRLAVLEGALARRRDPAAVPLDVFDRDAPRVLSLPAGRRRFRVGVFNDTDAPRAFALDLEWFGVARARVYEVEGSTRRLLGVVRRRWLAPPVPARGVRVFLIEGA